jgi:RNA polymerase sigma factor (sigma-70 family)
VTAAALRWNIDGASSDAELALASAAGDSRAFAGIYDRYADRLHDFCVGMLADRDGAADCVQDVFCIAATQLPRLRDPDRLRPWLYSIARNEALRRIRQRRRETPSEELPDMASDDASPDTLAARTELADLITEAAGGLSDRDRSVLELAFRHGLNGPDLAQALDVTPATANTIVKRLRDTIERSLGALLVSRRARNSGGCQLLAAILDGWDGHFNVLMRKRVSRHIESCDICDEERRRLVTPAALLGAAPAFIPAPKWLREQTLSEIELTSASHSIGDGSGNALRGSRNSLLPVAAFVIALFAAVGLTWIWLHAQNTSIHTSIKVSDTAPSQAAPTSAIPPPPPPTAAAVTPIPSSSAPPARRTPTVDPQTSEPAVPPLISEPTRDVLPSDSVPPVVLPPVSEPTPPAVPPLPDWTDWLPPLPPPPPPGAGFAGPGGLTAPPPGGSAVP